MALLKKFIWLANILFVSASLAAPPIDLTVVGSKDGEPEKKLKSIRSIKQSDLIFTEDHNQFNVKVPKDAGRMLYDVRGRSLPNRSGRVLFTLNEGDFVKHMKDSKDGKWLMLQTLETQARRAWVPIASVKLATPKTETKEAEPVAEKPAETPAP